MKQGFTLVELLIVMVIVGILVTIARPKYQASLERARSMEGINNLKAASDILNAHYVMNGNIYLGNGVVKCVGGTEGGKFITGDFTKYKYFTEPKASLSFESGVCYAGPQITVSRDDGSTIPPYSLIAYNENGEFIKIKCSAQPGTNYCEEIGAEKGSDNEYWINFVD